MSVAKSLKKLTRKVITLKQQDPDTGEPLSVTIRKVSVGEVTGRTGAPLSLRHLVGTREGETAEERVQRIREELGNDPESIRETMVFAEKTRNAVVCLGVVSEKVVDKAHDELAEDEMRPDDFGEDLPTVYNAILEFSGLPYQPLEVADMTRFPEESVAGPVLGNGERAGN